MKEDKGMNGQGIQSLELGIDILKKIGEADKPLSITDISELCGISKSKLHRYLTSFCRTGFLQRDSSLSYTIGMDLMAFGQNASPKKNIKDLAKPILTRIRDSLNETVFLSVWRGNGPIPIDIEESQRAINIGIKVGYPVSIVLTTSGRLFAAFSPASSTKEIIDKEIKEYKLDSNAFFQEVADIRKKGYSVTMESLIPGIVAVGCPVLDKEHHIIATISVVGILGILDLSPTSQVIKILKKECKELSKFL